MTGDLQGAWGDELQSIQLLAPSSPTNIENVLEHVPPNYTPPTQHNAGVGLMPCLQTTMALQDPHATSSSNPHNTPFPYSTDVHPCPMVMPCRRADCHVIDNPRRRLPRHCRATPSTSTSLMSHGLNGHFHPRHRGACSAPRLLSHDHSNLASLHGSVNWHSHCTCEVYRSPYVGYPWMGLWTRGFLKTLTPTHWNPYP